MAITGTTAREENRQSLQKNEIGLEDLDGFQLPVDVTEDFLDRVQKSTDILEMADTMTLERLEMEVPKFGVPRLSGGTRDEEGSRTEGSQAESGSVRFNVTDRSYYILVEPNRDALKNTHLGPDQFGEYIINQFVERWANDIAIIGMRANCADAPIEDITGDGEFDQTWNGWIARAEGELPDEDERIGLEATEDGAADEMPEFDHQDNVIDTELFNGAIQTLDDRYRDPNQAVFIVSPNQVQQYHYDLTRREDALGVPVLQGDNDVTPFDYDVIGLPEWPDSYGMLTSPDNLAYGLYEEMELDQTTDTDKVHEERLHSRNWLEGQFDFQIKELQAGVLVTNIADPGEA